MKKINYLSIHDHTLIVNLIAAWITLGYSTEDIIQFSKDNGYEITKPEIAGLTLCVNEQLKRALENKYESME